jgi:hypothetical protein
MYRVMPTRSVVLLCCAAVLGACSSGLEPDPANAPATTAVNTRSAASDLHQQITGNAFITLVDAGNAPERFTFSAVRHAGGVKGQFELFTAQEGGIRVHGTISCLGILAEGGELVGHLGGTITRSSAPGFEGANVIWTVVDAGEGSGAQDEASDLAAFAPPEVVEDFCDFAFGLPVLPSERGNIQIHP